MTRGKKIENPVKEGVISQIFARVYAEPKTGYQIAKELEYQHKNKIYVLLNEYSWLFEVEEKEEKGKVIKLYKGKTEELLKAIETELSKRGVILTEEERDELFKFLEVPFKKIVKNLVKKRKNVDLVEEFFTLMAILYIVTNPEKIFPNVNHRTKRKYKKGIKMLFARSFSLNEEDSDSLLRFGEENKELLEKLYCVDIGSPLVKQIIGAFEAGLMGLVDGIVRSLK